MNMLSMGISHWQYVWPFCSWVYLPDICLRYIFAGHCHFRHIFRALYFLTFFAGIVLEHSSLTLSNVACPSDMCNLATFPGHRILGIFPGHKFFGHKCFWACFMKINFLDMFPALL